MSYRCQHKREPDGAQCVLTPMHQGIVPCKFDRTPSAPAPQITPDQSQSPMNKTELRYSQHLDLQIKAGEVIKYWFEGIKFRLAGQTTYKPDFLVLTAEGKLEIHEVKGRKKLRSGKSSFWAEEDARIKIKVAAEMFGSAFKFMIVWPGDRGQWEHKMFN